MSKCKHEWIYLEGDFPKLNCILCPKVADDPLDLVKDLQEELAEAKAGAEKWRRYEEDFCPDSEAYKAKLARECEVEDE